jgi:hypothetical protein
VFEVKNVFFTDIGPKITSTWKSPASEDVLEAMVFSGKCLGIVWSIGHRIWTIFEIVVPV